MQPGARILIVEDEEKIANLLGDYLQAQGCITHHIARGDEVEEWVRHHPVDLVLLDVMLPGASGYDICRDLRGDPGLAQVRVLMMTARGSAAEQRRALDLGADGFISKPFAMADLRAEVARLMG